MLRTTRVLGVMGGKEGVCDALSTGAGCATYPMHVVLGHAREVKVDDIVDVLHVCKNGSAWSCCRIQVLQGWIS